MSTDGSPYSTLGLSPGADWDAVERAYKKLIKRYHPDREGGDAGRAAEINHAYRELRRARNHNGALNLGQQLPKPAASGNGWLWAATTAAVAVAVLLIATGPAVPLVRSLFAEDPAHPHKRVASARDPELMDQALSTHSINAAIRDALRIARSKDEVALATASSACHRELRLQPSLAQLDRCAAFDDAVVQLQDRDPLRDQGPFGELAVTARQMNAASTLSDDSLAIDGRLDRIRLQVELAMAPRLAPLPPPPAPRTEPANDEAPLDEPAAN